MVEHWELTKPHTFCVCVCVCVKTVMCSLPLTCGFHVICIYVSHVRVQSTVQIVLDNFPAVVVARTHENEGCTAGQREGFGHVKAHYYGEMEEK